MVVLQSAELEAQCFSSAEEFLESTNPGDGDCIVLDLLMPGMSGYDLVMKLASQGNKVPIIVVSALLDGEFFHQARKLGALAFLGKPVDDQVLIDTIHWALEGENNEN
jgi:two-component system response regulator FixJ